MALIEWQQVDTREDIEAQRYSGDPQELVELVGRSRRPAWHQWAACRGLGTAAWFPPRGGDVRPAQDVCAGCPVRSECLAAALEVSALADSGVWGGTSARQRRQLRRGAA